MWTIALIVLGTLSVLSSAFVVLLCRAAGRGEAKTASALRFRVALEVVDEDCVADHNGDH